MTKDEALDKALEALEIVKIHFSQNRHVNEAITAIKQALAQPVQEPHKGLSEHMAQALRGMVRIDPVTGDVGIGTIPAQPAQRKPLTDEQVDRCIEAADTNWVSAYVPIAWARHFAKAIEAAHGIAEKGQP